MSPSDWCLVLIFWLSMIGYLMLTTGVLLRHMQKEDDTLDTWGCRLVVYMFMSAWLIIILLLLWKWLDDIPMTLILENAAEGILAGMIIHFAHRYYSSKNKSQG